MTSIEMKKEFLVGYDKVANLNSPGYIDSEISYFLTKAQENFVFDYLHPAGNKYQENFEESEKVRKYLSNLLSPSVNDLGVVKTSLSTNQNGVSSPNSFFYDLAEDTWLPVLEWIVSDSKCNPRVKVRTITHDEYNMNIENPFRNPDDTEAWRLDVNNNESVLRHEIVTNGKYNILEYHVRYIKKLTPIVVDEDVTSNNVNCELHESTHRRIVDVAILLALETSEDRRIATFPQINNK